MSEVTAIAAAVESIGQASGEGSKHAYLSPSASKRWLTCHAAPVREADKPRESSSYAEWGVTVHEGSEICLKQGVAPASLLGRLINNMVFDEEMIECCEKYVSLILRLSDGHILFVENRLDISMITGEKGAKGTADAIILVKLPDGTYELCVYDLKTGKGVKEEAERNSQLMIYAAAALDLYEMIYDISSIRIGIVQPRLHHYPEWTCSVDDLREFAGYVKSVGLNILCGDASTLVANPTEDACRFCKAKANCRELQAKVNAVLTDWPRPDQTDADRIAILYKQLPLIEGWCTAVAEEAERRLNAGLPVTGYKLVEGRRGARAWENAAAIEEQMKAARIKHDVMYSYKLVSPTQAEKVLKEEKPRVWAKLAKQITQTKGNPTVAPLDDPRPAIIIASPEADFEAIEAPSAVDLSDIL